MFLITMRISISHWLFQSISGSNHKNFASFTVEIQREEEIHQQFFLLSCFSMPRLCFLPSLSAVSVNSIYVKRKKENHLVAIFVYFCFASLAHFGGFEVHHCFTITRASHNDGFMQIVILRNERKRDTEKII